MKNSLIFAAILGILVASGCDALPGNDSKSDPEITQELCEAITDTESCVAAGCTPACGMVLKRYGTEPVGCLERRRATICLAAVPYALPQVNNQMLQGGVVLAREQAWIARSVASTDGGATHWWEYILVDNSEGETPLIVLGYQESPERQPEDPCGDPDATLFPWQGSCDTWYSATMWDEIIYGVMSF